MFVFSEYEKLRQAFKTALEQYGEFLEWEPEHVPEEVAGSVIREGMDVLLQAEPECEDLFLADYIMGILEYGFRRGSRLGLLLGHVVRELGVEGVDLKELEIAGTGAQADLFKPIRKILKQLNDEQGMYKLSF